jgi:hypothetical protein
MLSGNIFISYRRDDTEGHAGRIFDRLSARFPGRVFMDITGINLGDDFVEAIEQQVAACRVFIELIGTQWATITDHAGKRRLDQPQDFVRLEVSAALRRSITVIPVLVHGATMPDSGSLPEDIAPITRHNALPISEIDFDHDVQRLIDRLNAIFAADRDLAPTQAPPARESKLHFGRRALIIGAGLFVLFLFGSIGISVRSYLIRSDSKAENANLKTRVNDHTGVLDSTNSSPTAKPIKPGKDNVGPPGTVLFVNSSANLDGDLAKHYVDFSFYYPKTWQKDPKAGVPGARNFVQVARSLPGDLTQESFAVGWYSSELDVHHVAENLSSQFAQTFSEYRKVSEGLTKAGPYTGYEFRFESTSRNTQRGDIHIWGRTILVPALDGEKNGVTLLMLTTSLAPELKSVNDVGLKGEIPVILQSFKLDAIR